MSALKGCILVFGPLALNPLVCSRGRSRDQYKPPSDPPERLLYYTIGMATFSLYKLTDMPSQTVLRIRIRSEPVFLYNHGIRISPQKVPVPADY